MPGKLSNINVGSSKFDGQAVIDQLRKFEEKKLDVIKNETASTTTKISAFGALTKGIESFQAAVSKLANPSSFGTLKSTSNDDAFTATITGKPIPINYNIEVISLATSQILQTQALSDRKAPVGLGGEVEFKLANGHTAKIELDNSLSLENIVEAINKQDNLGVRATLIADGHGANHLMISAKETGSNGEVTDIVYTGSNSTLKTLFSYSKTDPSSSSLIEAVKANDATLKINGLAVKSSSNTVKDVLDGITLNLNKISTKPGNLSITVDDSSTLKDIEEFVSTYNALQKSIAGLTHYDSANRKPSILTGDSVVRNVQNSLAIALRSFTSGGSIRTLAQIGITTNTSSGNSDLKLDNAGNSVVGDGQLTLDKNKLIKMLHDHPKDLAAVFSDKGGIGEKVEFALKGILKNGSSKGSIELKVEGLKKIVKDQGQLYAIRQGRINDEMALMEKKFINLGKQLASFEKTESFLNKQFEKMSK